MFRNLSLAFSAGCLGGLANSIVVWASGTLGITAALGVKIAPALTLPWLYPRIVWGGIWGFLFIISIPGLSWWMRGLVFSLGPSLVVMLVLFPRNPLVGEFGLGLGTLTPAFVLVFNAVWGLVAAWWLKQVGPN